MLIDASLPPLPLSLIPSFARAAEELGFDAIWSSETLHDPFLPGALIAEHTQRLHFGTAVAIAFARSPGTLAYTAWDLAQASGGRFILGLGTQVKAHVERRFGMPWPDSVVGKLREQVAALRAFWSAWQDTQGSQRLNFRGEYYKLTLMTPFFNPGPIEHPAIPIYLAGVNTGLARLAGEIAQGFHVHPLHSRRYLTEVVLPALGSGALHAGRSRADVKVTVTAFAVTNPEDELSVRAQIAFYASTPSYRPVMALHGWGEVAERLSRHASHGEWDKMPALIDDEMLATFAVIAPANELPAALSERYRRIADRLSLYIPFKPGERDEFWRTLIQSLHKE